jgi:gliding motility-associated-like protein
MLNQLDDTIAIHSRFCKLWFPTLLGMIKFNFQIKLKSIATLIALMLSCNVMAQTVTNGSLNGGPTGNNLIGPNCPSWTVCGFSPDYCDIGFPSYAGGSQVAVSDSPDGQPWLGMAAVGAGECAQTTITGLTVGDTYTLCFWGACFGTGALFNSGPSNPEICVGGTCQTFTIPMAANTWNLYTMTFTAANATEVLSCNLTGDNSYCSLDGFTIAIPGATATWNNPSPLCAAQAPVNLDGFVTGTPGGVWSGTGVTGSTFDPGSGTQSITYTVNPGSCNEVSVTQTITVTGSDASWTVPTPVCANDAPINLDALVTGTAGGTWSGTGVTGNTFDPANGTQPITYTVGVPPCDDAVTQTIIVTPGGDASWTPPTGLCATSPLVNLDLLVTGTGGGTWSGTGVTGNQFDPASGSQTITYTVGNPPCQDVSSQLITVGGSADASWTAPTALCASSAPVDLNAFITGDLGGTWTGTGMTGSNFDPGVGTQTITYTVGTAPCDDFLTLQIDVAATASAAWDVPAGLCLGDAPVDLNTFITGMTGGTWTGTGITGSLFDPSVGTQSITYSVGTAPCDDIVTQTITVTPLSDPGWTIPANVCESDPPFDLSPFVTGAPGGVWSGTGITGTTFDPSVGTQSITYTAGTGGCQDLLTQNITVDVAPDPSWTNITVCSSSPVVDLTPQITGDVGGSWSGSGVIGTTFDPSAGAQAITYSVTVGACTAELTQTVNIVDPTLSLNMTPVTCPTAGDGTATVNVTGGSGNYSYSWNTNPVQTTATATGLTGGWVSVTVTDLTGGCIVTDSVLVVEPPAIVLNMSSFPACSPSTGSAAVSASGGVGGFTYSWTPVASTDSIVNGIDSAMAVVVVTDGNGCTATDSIFVDVYPEPLITVNPDTLIYWGDFVQLNASGGVTYSWTPIDYLDCDDCPDPIAAPEQDITYCVNAVDANGCVSDTCTTIFVEIVCGDIFVPSAFSPNDDGENDFLCVYSDCMEQMTFTIYNRWGEEVFQSSDMGICWDGTWNGKELNPAVFVYTLTGFLINGEAVDQKGNISLIR